MPKDIRAELDGYGKEKLREDDHETFKRSIKIEDDVKETLAAKPVKHLLKDLQKYLSIRYDKLRGRLMMNYDGTDAERLPLLKKDQLIYQNKIEDATVNDQR